MEELFGGFLVGEGILSVLFSQDQRFISNTGRALRIMVGFWLIHQGSTYKQLATHDRYKKLGKGK